MNSPVSLFSASSSFHPTGTGSHTYSGFYNIVVQNLAYRKYVSIWAQIGNNWKDFPANYYKMLPYNFELWRVNIEEMVDTFVVRYIVNERIFWGKLYGYYNYPMIHGGTNFFIGDNFDIVMNHAYYNNDDLIISIYLRNYGHTKSVGIVLTKNNWISQEIIPAHFEREAENETEVWNIERKIGQANEIKFAVFYKVNGKDYWDNNFNRNYSVTKSKSAEWGNY